MIIRVECGCDHKYGELTTPDASTNACLGLMIMSGVGTTYMMGGTYGYCSGSQRRTGMLYLTPFTSKSRSKKTTGRVPWSELMTALHMHLIVHGQSAISHEQGHSSAICVGVLLDLQSQGREVLHTDTFSALCYDDGWCSNIGSGGRPAERLTSAAG